MSRLAAMVSAFAGRASMLEVAVGDHLLLPQGQRLVLCKVRTVESRYVTVKYYSRLPDAKPTKPSAVDYQELTWWRQNPKKAEEDIEKLTVPFLTKAQVKKGFEPWQEKLHINLFYQRVVRESDLKVSSKKGISVKPLRLAAILKTKPMVPQSDMLETGWQLPGDPTHKTSKQSKGSKVSGGRLIEATDKQPKSAHIRRRVKMAVGKTVEAALKMQVPDKDGDMVRYKKSDFKYDVKAGFLRF